MEAILPLIAMFGLMWLLLIRPQQRRVRQHQAVVAAIQPGDEVITAGGIHGIVHELEDDGTVLIEISPDVIVRVLTGAISQRLTPPEELDEDDDGAGDDADTTDDDDDNEVEVEVAHESPSENGTKPGKVEAVGEDQP